MKEEDIRPQELFDTYLSLARRDLITYFRDSPFHFISCPACGDDYSLFRFRNLFFDYEECSACGTLFVNPRPPPEAFSRYYQEAPSVQFWATNFYRETEAARREQVVRPKVERVRNAITRHLGSLPGGSSLVDIGAGYGLFCEEFQRSDPLGIQVIAIEPASLLAGACREKGISTVPKFLEDVTPGDIGRDVAVATSFELLEHLQDPGCFIRRCHDIVMEGGLLILTTLSWAGFDLQVLQEESKSIHPPHHINFFTPYSIRVLLDRNGFETIEVTTPGSLDVDIVRKQKEAVTDPFLKRLLDADERTRDLFQTFLRDAGLSSHMMAVARRS
jgi:2-polyprenyl-3-methyl-5-hydroxy-6-metoxy-1,4-benzoquinol methylase